MSREQSVGWARCTALFLLLVQVKGGVWHIGCICTIHKKIPWMRSGEWKRKQGIQRAWNMWGEREDGSYFNGPWSAVGHCSYFVTQNLCWYFYEYRLKFTLPIPSCYIYHLDNPSHTGTSESSNFTVAHPVTHLKSQKTQRVPDVCLGLVTHPKSCCTPKRHPQHTPHLKLLALAHLSSSSHHTLHTWCTVTMWYVMLLSHSGVSVWVPGWVGIGTSQGSVLGSMILIPFWLHPDSIDSLFLCFRSDSICFQSLSYMFTCSHFTMFLMCVMILPSHFSWTPQLPWTLILLFQISVLRS